MAFLWESLIAIGLKIGVAYLAELLQKKLGIGLNNPVMDALCDYNLEHRDLKKKTRSRVKRCFGPQCNSDRQTLGGNR